MNVLCEHCFISFEKKIAEVKRTRHNFCSKQCKSDYYANSTIDGRYAILESGCWEFLGTINNKGYGVMRYNKKPMLAHRAAYIIFNKNVDINKLSVCHKCDNPKCINPSHLFVGTHKDNMDDMRRKGRGREKLSYLDVQNIRNSTESNKILSGKYNVSERAIRYAKEKGHWEQAVYNPQGLDGTN